MTIDQNTAAVLLGAFGVLNTALLVYQAIRLQSVHSMVDGAKTAAVQAATLAGYAAAAVGAAPPPPPK
jgi:hypothetical protein